MRAQVNSRGLGTYRFWSVELSRETSNLRATVGVVCQVFIGNVSNRCWATPNSIYVSLCIYTTRISLCKTRKCTPRWHISGVVLHPQYDYDELDRSFLLFVVPDFTHIHSGGRISHFIGFPWFSCMFYIVLLYAMFCCMFYCLKILFEDILSHGLPIGHPDICLEPADPLDAEGHQAEATLRTWGGSGGMKQITFSNSGDMMKHDITWLIIYYYYYYYYYILLYIIITIYYSYSLGCGEHRCFFCWSSTGPQVMLTTGRQPSVLMCQIDRACAQVSTISVVSVSGSPARYGACQGED